ncbi:MAG: acetyl-CoA carboxylase biotin carboxyl carrier protein subunit [Eubacteriales bacterium]|nr:acetyl-CoA carboxylase biotin carboxyl carrier protein subunit [Eubacteriales bacterium]
MSKYRIKILDKIYELEIEQIFENDRKEEKRLSDGWKSGTAVNAVNPNVRIIDSQALKKTVNAENAVYSPIPGTVVKVCAKNGELVKKGKPVLVIEAMKMENEIISPKDGIVSELNVTEHQTIQGGELLFYIN